MSWPDRNRETWRGALFSSVRVISQRDGGSCEYFIDACGEAGLLNPGRLQHILDHMKDSFSPEAIHFDVSLRRPGLEGVVSSWAWE